ncbi:MAG: hypothetical protein IKQ97_11190 [Eubacterium sp.]|nr:hypothetical protein [Eubacterium sp.]
MYEIVNPTCTYRRLQPKSPSDPAFAFAADSALSRWSPFVSIISVLPLSVRTIRSGYAVTAPLMANPRRDIRVDRIDRYDNQYHYRKDQKDRRDDTILDVPQYSGIPNI